ncbi:hypothetical protein LWC08_00535 [Desulfobaculum bizertense]|uniref:CBS domain-containing protein n=1 Tax=Desulfobaculum bizertense TaxID=376490 RepID=UPI001F3DE3AA|nr:CBS domain-containing protein [Desulfobaculum bizertense]UIJ38082.1 hypothetical protein LWC08_00535 [Desulfobaculum bizertense]
MLLRKRAWDLMREDVTRGVRGENLIFLLRRMQAAIERDADNHVAVIEDSHGHYLGVITMWDVVGYFEKQIFQRDELVDFEHADWDKAFATACRLSCHIGVEKLMRQHGVPCLEPTTPMILILENLQRDRRDWALVREGEKILGVVLKTDIFQEIGDEVLQVF